MGTLSRSGARGGGPRDRPWGHFLSPFPIPVGGSDPLPGLAALGGRLRWKVRFRATLVGQERIAFSPLTAVVNTFVIITITINTRFKLKQKAHQLDPLASLEGEQSSPVLGPSLAVFFFFFSLSLCTLPGLW